MSENPITESWGTLLNEEYKAITERMAEHQRLQLAVVEAAKMWRHADLNYWTDGEHPIENNLRVAIDALIKFEAEQKNGNT